LEKAVRFQLSKLRAGADRASEDRLVADLEQVARRRGRGALGLCTDVLTVISSAMTRPRIRAGSDAVRRAFWDAPKKAVLASLVQAGSREANEACARWLLAGTLQLDEGEIVCEGVRVPCTAALDALACFVMGGRSMVWEGYWDEGGGNDVNETKTWREHSKSCIARRQLSIEECIALAHYIVCEAASSGGGEISMGRMPVLLEAIGLVGVQAARRVGDELMKMLTKLAAMVSSMCISLIS
jgi:hypothetical protein